MKWDVTCCDAVYNKCVCVNPNKMRQFFRSSFAVVCKNIHV